MDCVERRHVFPLNFISPCLLRYFVVVFKVEDALLSLPVCNRMISLVLPTTDVRFGDRLPKFIIQKEIL